MFNERFSLPIYGDKDEAIDARRSFFYDSVQHGLYFVCGLRRERHAGKANDRVETRLTSKRRKKMGS
jgi:hypothetical protein